MFGVHFICFMAANQKIASVIEAKKRRQEWENTATKEPASFVSDKYAPFMELSDVALLAVEFPANFSRITKDKIVELVVKRPANFDKETKSKINQLFNQPRP